MLQRSLHNFVVTAGLLLPTIVLNIPEAIAHPLDFTFHNRTRFPVVSLYVSPSNSPDWEEDVLGRDILPRGRSTGIAFEGNYGTCYFDIMAVFPDGSSVEKGGFNLCKLTDISLP